MHTSTSVSEVHKQRCWRVSGISKIMPKWAEIESAPLAWHTDNSLQCSFFYCCFFLSLLSISTLLMQITPSLFRTLTTGVGSGLLAQCTSLTLTLYLLGYGIAAAQLLSPFHQSSSYPLNNWLHASMPNAVHQRGPVMQGEKVTWCKR